MMGRAGRPQYDDHGVAVVLVHDVKKHFYKKFLYEPFPVESSLHGVLPDHLNAEIVAGTIQVCGIGNVYTLYYYNGIAGSLKQTILPGTVSKIATAQRVQVQQAKCC